MNGGIYYLCDYPAVANVYIRHCDSSQLKSEAAVRIWAIVAGNDGKNLTGIDLMLRDNDGTIHQQIKSDTRDKNSNFRYSSVYDFFESRLLEQGHYPLYSYICYRFNIENGTFGYWPIFVKKGL